MRRVIVLLTALAVLAAACSSKGTPSATSTGSTASATSTSGANALADIGQGLKGPAGLQATVDTTGLTHAAAMVFDDQSRLWVATADYSDAGQDAVYVVAAGGGAPAKAIDGLHTPLGLLWYQQSLLVASHEKIESYRGFDGTAFASHTTVISLPAGVGEVNGMVLAPDGRVQLGISAPCDHCTPTLEQSAAIISFAPDGTDGRVDAKGIRAPIGLAYFPGTSDLFVTMNHRDDLGDTTPGDWLSVVRTGDSWGFPDCYGQGGPACTGVPSPIAVLDKHAAVDGIAIVTGQLGASVGTAAIVAEWAAGKVLQVALTKTGPTYAGTVTTFLDGLQNPVPVVLGADGAVYVGDWTTGTIYRITKT